MHLSLLIASRGRPVELLRTITESDAQVADPAQTTISVALDWDDESMTAVTPPATRCKLHWHVGEREDSLGAKYNRAAAGAPAEAYVLGADDNVLVTPGWDQRLREAMGAFNEGCGFVFFGRLDGTLPTNMAVPHRLQEIQGFLFPPFFPVWFYDTWIDEIGHLCGRILWADVKVEELGGRGMSRGVRDVAFWASLFDALRGPRLHVAAALATLNPPWMQLQLEQRRDILGAFFASRMARLRDPQQAFLFEKRMSFDAPEDARYLRIKAQAEELLRQVHQARQDAA